MKKVVYLFIALLLPIGIFLFLKIFARNEFDVQPLFVEKGETQIGCFPITYPYAVPDSVLNLYPFPGDSLLLIRFDDKQDESDKQWTRLTKSFQSFRITLKRTPAHELKNPYRRKCIFLLQEPLDLVLLDTKGVVRGQYLSSDREDVDRLITEVTILLKKY